MAIWGGHQRTIPKRSHKHPCASPREVTVGTPVSKTLLRRYLVCREKKTMAAERNGRSRTRAVLRLFFVSLLAVAVVPLGGCSRTPVTYIQVFKTTSGTAAGVPPGTWAEGVPVRPRRTEVQAVFMPGDRIYLGIKIDPRLSGNVTFSRYTFFNTAARQERPVEDAKELGPFEPGQVLLVGLPWGWPVPSAAGRYEIRIYVGEKVIASAAFDVRTQ